MENISRPDGPSRPDSHPDSHDPDSHDPQSHGAADDGAWDVAHARDALAAVRLSEAALADRIVTPWWYHPTLGGLAALLVLAYGSDRGWAVPVGLVIFMAGVTLLVRAYRRLTGVWVSGPKAGRATRYAYALGGLLAVCLLGAFWAGRAGADGWVPALAVLAFVGTVVIGRRFDATLRDDLRAGRAAPGWS